MVVSLDEIKQYLRIDTDAENDTLATLIDAAENLCKDVARVDNLEGEIAKIAVLYTVAYWYEHREDADTHALTLRLRALLFGVRKEVL